MTVQINRNHAVAIAAFCLGVFVGAAYMGHRADTLYRARLHVARLETSLVLGQSKQQVRQALHAGTFESLKVFEGEADWTVSTPVEWGATGWMLVLEFEGDVLVAMRYRTQDGGGLKPPGAKADREMRPVASGGLPEPAEPTDSDTQDALDGGHGNDNAPSDADPSTPTPTSLPPAASDPP